MDKEKQFIKNLKESNYKNYENVKSADKLILYIIDLLEKNNIEPRFDHIAITAFKIFPKVFSLPLYNEYPDALRVDHCILHCSYGNKWLDGSIKQGFKVNEIGKKILNEFVNELSNQKKERAGSKRIVNRKEKVIIDQLRKTKAFLSFKNKSLDKLDFDYLKEALRCTPNSDNSLLKNNYLKILRYAEEINADEEIFEFLNKIKILLKLE
jgi:hypothetical protein